MMLIVFSTIHVVLCITIIGVILLQPGKDAGMGAALGGGAATTAFGGRGAATFLTKLTGVCAVAFFLTSLGLSFVGLRTSVASTIAAKAAAETPVKTETTPATGAAPAGAQQGNAETTGKTVPTEAKPSGSDAVPAEKLPQ
jgi:preprotein translocase subunit SecG